MTGLYPQCVCSQRAVMGSMMLQFAVVLYLSSAAPHARNLSRFVVDHGGSARGLALSAGFRGPAPLGVP